MKMTKTSPSPIVEMTNTSAVTRVGEYMESKASVQASSRSRSTANKNNFDTSEAGAGEEQTIVFRHNKYMGESKMKNGKPQGEGTITYARGGDVYIGLVKDGKPDGFGKMTTEFGDSYEGEWSYGQKNGFGKYTSVHGNVYEGGWSKGSEHGKGKMMWESGMVYEGDYYKGRQHGHGNMTTNFYVYEGSFVHGKMQGVGEMRFKDRDGEVVKGSWMNDSLRNGKVLYPDGDEYVGELQDGFPHGQGKLTTASGIEYEGEWKYGRLRRLV